MTLDQYITILQDLRTQHGGLLDVQKWMPAKGRHEAPVPSLAYVRRHSTRGVANFFHEATDTPAQKGAPVIRV